MAVFANEGNVSQDANFRRHLDDNWDSGNREFDKIEGLLDTLKENINGYQEEFDQLKQDVDALTRQINDLNETIEKQDARISKLEDAVFNAEYINDTDDKPDVDHSTKVSEINDDIVPDPSTNDSSAVVIESDNDDVIPDKIN